MKNHLDRTLLWSALLFILSSVALAQADSQAPESTPSLGPAQSAPATSHTQQTSDRQAAKAESRYKPEPIRRYSGKTRLDEFGRPREGSRKTLPERSGEAIIP